MLTRDEAEKVIGWLEEYPAGIPSRSWGFGPLEQLRNPAGVPESTVMKYG